tara:strand:- start:3826 stop:5484 length:1659 start_codon:yes stop_codon:yes gene_type:complete
MGIKKFTAIADATITNAFKPDLATRGTGANTGLADSLEVFSIYNQVSGNVSGSSQELSRVLLKFPVTTTDDSTNSIQAQRTAGKIPSSGSVNFFLRLYNVKHHATLPRNAKYNIFAVSSSWEEGTGIDLDTYEDITRDAEGTNWIFKSSGSTWLSPGGDYHTGTSGSNYLSADENNVGVMYNQTLEHGPENIEIDISELVEQWVAGIKNNYGVGVFLTGTQEAYYSASFGADLPSWNGGVKHHPTGALKSFFTKKFSSRSSEYFFGRPVIEARWDSTEKDDRNNFYFSSSLATSAENLNTLYLYNYFRGALRNIPSIGEGNIYVSVFSGSTENTEPSGSALVLVTDGTNVTSVNTRVVTGGYVSTGVYTASFALTAGSTPVSSAFDVWFSGSGDIESLGYTAEEGVQMQTGSFAPKSIENTNIAPATTFASNIVNLRSIYSRREAARFRVYTRQKNWNPSIYSRATATTEPYVIESGSYRVYRVIDDLEVIPHGTGSNRHTEMSFDASGSYFDFDIDMLQAGYSYAIKLAFYNGSVGGWVEQPETFKFRVEE